MKLSPIGLFVITIGAVAGICIWVAGIIFLPNVDTHRDLSNNPSVATSAGNSTNHSGGSSSSSGNGGSGSSGNSTASTGSGGSNQAPSQLVTLPKKSASDINLIDTSMPGYQIFQQTCAACHGNKLQGGVGPAIYAIGQHWSVGQITAFVKKGRGMMPPKGGLSSDSQINQVVAWLAKQTG